MSFIRHHLPFLSSSFVPLGVGTTVLLDVGVSVLLYVGVAVLLDVGVADVISTVIGVLSCSLAEFTATTLMV